MWLSEKSRKWLESHREGAQRVAKSPPKLDQIIWGPGDAYVLTPNEYDELLAIIQEMTMPDKLERYLRARFDLYAGDGDGQEIELVEFERRDGTSWILLRSGTKRMWHQIDNEGLDSIDESLGGAIAQLIDAGNWTHEDNALLDRYS